MIAAMQPMLAKLDPSGQILAQITSVDQLKAVVRMAEQQLGHENTRRGRVRSDYYTQGLIVLS